MMSVNEKERMLTHVLDGGFTQAVENINEMEIINLYSFTVHFCGYGHA